MQHDFMNARTKMHVHFMSPFWVVQQAANGGLLHDPIVGGARKKCTERETVVGFHQGGAERLRRSAIFVSGMHKMCRQPEMRL